MSHESLNSVRRVRKRGEGEDFTGDTSLLPREEEWMRVNNVKAPMETDTANNNDTSQRSFSDAVRGGGNPMGSGNPVIVETVPNPLSTALAGGRSYNNAENEGGSHGNDENAGFKRHTEPSQEPEIKLERMNGIFNFVLNEAAMKKLRFP
ncbi:hypothetical protein PIB30_076923 [Stylosanthes scabra]|uniref:Uncharacterized protein n=1 Tax=Stylosanthes scabra TaxID=79078 RepID=A0ABU6YT46_9FABA|nr:hypothetical protein [Stylosanthes scabra]